MAGEGFRFDPNILREYDIRGVVPPGVGASVTEEAAYHLGRAFGTILVQGGGRTVCVGYDGRVSSPGLSSAVVKGLMACGARVLEIGLGPTPMLYYAVHAQEADAGIMVTGSHNPPDNNGFKMMMGRDSFFGADIQRLGAVAAAGDYVDGAGDSESCPVLDAYVARLRSDLDAAPWGRPLSVAWDAGNGAAGEAMRMLATGLPGRHQLLYEAIDGTFPNHHPDPTVPENLADLKAVVLRDRCDVGIAFDGDGDRIGVLDEQGRILWGDQILLLLAREVLADRPGSMVIADVKASQVLFDEVAHLGGQPIMWKTGHSLIKSKMKQTGAPLAGEMSGHIFLADRYYGYDDAIYVALRLLGMLSRSDQSLAALRDTIPASVSTPEIRLPCPDDRKFDVVAAIRDRLLVSGGTVSDVDGVRVTTEDGWWLLRASNTQPMLVTRCEARDSAGLDRLKASVREQLDASDVDPGPL